jgi:exopolysaccharide production protein ExoZ
MKPLRLTLGAPVRGRLPVLDELKGVAILLIILYHAGGVLSWANTLHGEVGVDMFVILSGIGLTLSGGHETAARFLGRRFLRIYPSYWIALTATLVAGAYFRGNHYAPADIVLHYLGIHAWFGDAKAMSINDSFWFITLIVTLYVVYLPMRPLLGRPDRLLLAGMALSLLLAWVHLRAGMPVGFVNLSMRFPGFFLGLVVGRLLRDGTLELPLSPALAGAAFLFLYVPNPLGFIFTSVWIGVGLMATYAFGAGPLLPALGRRVLSFLGGLSLEIFLLHQPLIRDWNIYILQRFFPSLGLAPTVLIFGMAVGLAVAIGLSVLLQRLLRPLNRLLARPVIPAAA